MSDEIENERAKLFGSTLNDDGSLRCVSASQIKTFKRCPRAWYYDKVVKLPRKEKGKGAALGTECHARMESFLNTGVDVRGPLERHGDEMIRPYLHRAPFNGGDMLIEAPMLDPQLRTADGILISGFIDVALPLSAESEPAILDHKFKKKLEQYADTAEYLAADEPQAVMYSTWAAMKWPLAREVTFRHHNHQSQGPRLNMPVSITDDRDVIYAKFARLGKFIDEEMAPAALKKSAADVKASGDTDPSACRAFGGCDFLAQCPSSPHNRYMKALMSGSGLPENNDKSKWSPEPATQGYDLMGLLDEMDSAGSTAVAANVPASVTPKAGGLYMLPTGPVGKYEGTLGDRMFFKGSAGEDLVCPANASLRDMSADFTTVSLFQGAKGAPAPAAEPAKKERKLHVDDKSTLPDTTPAINPASGIVPKDAPADTNPPKVATPAVAPAESAPAPSAEAPATEPAAEAKKRGRPAGAKNKATLSGAGTDLIILVNNACPAAEDLQPYVQGLADAIAKRENLTDLRVAPKGSDASYSGWKGLMAVAAKLNPPPPGLYVIQGGELAEPVLEALSSIAVVSYGRGR